MGDLARLICLASEPANQKPEFVENPDGTEWLVAGGAGFEPTTFRLWDLLPTT